MYQSLVTSDQPLDATGVVKGSGVPRAKVYEVLHRLAEKGMILESTVEKNAFILHCRLSLPLKNLKQILRRMCASLREAKSKQTITDDRVWTLKDNQSIQSFMKGMLDGAEQSVILSGWSDDLSSYLPSLEKNITMASLSKST